MSRAACSAAVTIDFSISISAGIGRLLLPVDIPKAKPAQSCQHDVPDQADLLGRQPDIVKRPEPFLIELVLDVGHLGADRSKTVLSDCIASQI